MATTATPMQRSGVNMVEQRQGKNGHWVPVTTTQKREQGKKTFQPNLISWS